MTGPNKITELSALLDGELRGEHLELLNQQLNSDASLAGEFEAQRGVKTLLAQLPEFETPDYMSTRVLGLIAERRDQKKSGFAMSWRLLTAGAAGFALCLLSLGTFIIANNPSTDAERTVASAPADDGFVLPPGATQSTDGMYTAQDWDNASLVSWREMDLSEEDKAKVDDRLEEFLQFAAQVHGYELTLRTTDATSADIPEAMLLMVGDEGGSH